METAVISWGVIFYNRMKFRSNPFNLSIVIESSSWFSHIHSTHTVCKMKQTKQTLKLGPTLKVALVWMFQFHRYVVNCVRYMGHLLSLKGQFSGGIKNLNMVKLTKDKPHLSNLEKLLQKLMLLLWQIWSNKMQGSWWKKLLIVLVFHRGQFIRFWFRSWNLERFVHDGSRISWPRTKNHPCKNGKKSFKKVQKFWQM